MDSERGETEGCVGRVRGKEVEDRKVPGGIGDEDLQQVNIAGCRSKSCCLERGSFDRLDGPKSGCVDWPEDRRGGRFEG